MHPLIDKAIKFAARAHQGQFRKGSDVPYISHPFAVALILQEAGASPEQVMAGILHDVIEDTDCTAKELETHFGKKVAELVHSCSEYDPKAPWELRKKRTHEFLKTASSEIHLIVCADKLHNLRSIVEDQALIGEEVWKKFGRGRESQAWYYRNLVDILCKELKIYPEDSIFHQFKSEVEALFGGAD
jgi:(p)ppGpp synthase/HD superfamily hydrolase